MKKFLFLFAIFTITLSCSSSDDSGSDSGHKVSFKLDGVEQNFDDVTVENINDNSYLRVEAINATYTVSFLLFPESTPTNSFSDFHFFEGTNFYHEPEEFNSNVTMIHMNGGRLKGTFSGQLMGQTEEGTPLPGKTVTDGRFNFTY